MTRARRKPYSLQFAPPAWARIGALDARAFEALQQALEHAAERASELRAHGGRPVVDENVPIAAGVVIADCTFDDFSDRCTVNELLFWDRPDPSCGS